MAANYSDAARRMTDEINLHRHAGIMEGRVAIRLSDGGSDGRVYDTLENAIRFQLHPTQCAYIKLGFEAMTPRVAESLLATHRMVYAAGHRFADPAYPKVELMMSNQTERYQK